MSTRRSLAGRPSRSRLFNVLKHKCIHWIFGSHCLRYDRLTRDPRLDPDKSRWPVTKFQLWPKWPNGLVIYLWLLVAAALTSFFRFQPLDGTDGPQTATSSTTDRHQQCCRRSAVLLAHGTHNSKSAVYYHTAKILTYNKILTTSLQQFHTLQYYFVYKRSIQTRRRLVQVWHFVRTNDKNSIC